MCFEYSSAIFVIANHGYKSTSLLCNLIVDLIF